MLFFWPEFLILFLSQKLAFQMAHSNSDAIQMAVKMQLEGMGSFSLVWT